jgi:uncharacterized protein (DUF2147 family)
MVQYSDTSTDAVTLPVFRTKLVMVRVYRASSVASTRQASRVTENKLGSSGASGGERSHCEAGTWRYGSRQVEIASVGVAIAKTTTTTTTRKEEQQNDKYNDGRHM